MKHTPGPWFTKPIHGEPNQSMIVLRDGEGGWVAALQHNGQYMPEIQERNAFLMTAAPELLEACDYALAVLELGERGQYTRKGAIDRLIAAMSKAEGRN